MKEFLEIKARPFCKECRTPLWEGEIDFTLSDCGSSVLDASGEITYYRTPFGGKDIWRLRPEKREAK